MNLRGTLLPALMLVIGIAIVVRTVAAGGGPIATGLIVGLLFCLAGGLRLYAERQGR